MNIKIQTPGFKASDELINHVNNKVEKLFRQNDKIIRADVSLFEDNSGIEKQTCEISLSIPGENLFVKKNAVTYEESIIEATEVLLKMMRRKKEQIISGKKSG